MVKATVSYAFPPANSPARTVEVHEFEKDSVKDLNVLDKWLKLSSTKLVAFTEDSVVIVYNLGAVVEVKYEEI